MSSEVPPMTMDAPPSPTLDDLSSHSSSHMVYGILLYGLFLVAGIGGAVYYFMFVENKPKTKKVEADVDDVMTTNTVGLKDVTYLVSQLSPESSHLDVLYAVASTPENIAYGLKAYENKEKIRRERIEEDLKEAKKKQSRGGKNGANDKSSDVLFDFDNDDGGWADDDDDDEKAKLAAHAEEEKKKEREQLEKAVGKVKILLEGLDEGVIGQKWVENTLSGKGVWPPKNLGILEGKKFDYHGKLVSALDHPGLRRNLCQITGRLNSLMLNAHPELLEAGSKQLIDQTYFKGSMEFRGRCALLLEAALRMAVACRNLPLSKTIVETVAIFKIGTTSPGMTTWFDGVMQKQYECLPRLQIDNTFVECPNEKEMATGDVLALGMEVTRLHAEAFTRQKIAMFQKQGIPPQIALQTYREGWWFLLHAERLDGDTPGDVLELRLDGILQEVEEKDIAKFQKAPFKERLLTAWPMVVQNVAQKTGKVKIQFLAPPVPGRYKFTATVKSQDFLGADQEFSVEGTIVDASTVVRKPKEEKPNEQEEGNKEDPEAKKDN